MVGMACRVACGLACNGGNSLSLERVQPRSGGARLDRGRAANGDDPDGRGDTDVHDPDFVIL